MKRTENRKIQMMCLTGVLLALVLVFTAYLHVPLYSGYVHVGDAFLYLAACLLPHSYAIVAGAGGALLADVLGGYAVWAPGSAAIKVFMVLCFSWKGSRVCSRRNLLALFPAAFVCAGGYYLYGGIIAGNFVAPLVELPGNALQSVCSSIVFVVLAKCADKFGIKRMLEQE